MMRRLDFARASVCAIVTFAAACAWAAQSPMLAERVAKGELPPLEQRLPSPPYTTRFTQPYQSPGKYGGDLVMLMGRSKDVRLMVVYGYARLVGYDLKYEFVPDVLESFEVEEDRRFTFHLRKGHRWSDGHPFTAEAFRYYWEDIASNTDLAAFGPPPVLLVDGQPPEFEVIDETTVRYTWHKPNPYFLPALAGARPETIFAPGHYLKQFHARYTDIATLEELASKEGRRNWASVHIARFRPYKNINPELPTLQPWVNTTEPPSQRFVFRKKPLLSPRRSRRVAAPVHRSRHSRHRRWQAHTGQDRRRRERPSGAAPQLQRLHISQKEREANPSQGAAVEYDTWIAHRALPEPECPGPRCGVNWCATCAFAVPCLLPSTATKLTRSSTTALRGKETIRCFQILPMFKPEYLTAWAEFNLKKANALLDEVGLDKRDDEGLRLLPDGRPLEIIVETAGESTEQVDVLELISSSWRKAGIKLFSKPLQREVFRNRIYSGETLMSVWGGLENGLPTPDMSPSDLAPTRQDQYQWPKWGQYHETGGKVGEAPDLPAAEKLMELNSQWLTSSSTAERKRIWQLMLDIRADEAFTIGIVSGVPQPVVINHKLRNIPKKGIYNWDPGAHFGIYHPDTFWFDQ